MVFIDLKKAYDKVFRDLICWALEKKCVTKRYIEMIQDMYSGAMTIVRTTIGKTNNFSIRVGLHQESALSPYLFTLVMDELARHMQDEVPRCMLFAYDIIRVAKTKVKVNAKLELQREVLESKGLKISKNKTEYLECNFNKNQGMNEQKQVASYIQPKYICGSLWTESYQKEANQTACQYKKQGKTDKEHDYMEGLKKTKNRTQKT